MTPRLLTFIGVPAALVALVTLWTTLGFPRLATSADIQRLDRNQALQAVELYNNKVRSLLSVPAPSAEPGASVWKEEVAKARRQQNAAEQRWLELSK